MTVAPTSAAVTLADCGVVQPKPPGYGYTDSLPLGNGSLESLRIDTPDGSPPAEIKISRSPDTLQTEWSATSTEMAGGSPPADIDILRKSGYTTDRVVRDVYGNGRWKPAGR